MHQDANYNVVALTAGSGHPDGQGGTLDEGTLLEQYAYEPYGVVLVAESFASHAVNRVGHQGLFFERYDGTSFRQTVSPTENGLYYNRNRFYDPSLGRFIQRDPNETGIPIIAALAMNGQAVDVLLSGFDPEAVYAFGLNLYEYVGSNPVVRVDPSGTTWITWGGSPISLRLVKSKQLLWQFFLCWVERLVSPISVAVARGTHPGLRWLATVPGGHVPVTHQDQGCGTVREDPFPAPGSSEPQKTVGTRSCPIH